MGADRGCSSKSFVALIWTQGFSALNDSLFRNSLKLLLVVKFAGAAAAATYLSVGQGLFILPMIILSGYTGYYADRYPKSFIIKATKFSELVLAAFALFFFWIENLTGLFLLMFLWGIRSAFFTPPKYGALPELLDDEHLSRGNGLVGSWTFFSVLLGTAMAAFLVGDNRSSAFLLPGITILIVAIAGYISCIGIERLPVKNPHLYFEKNPFKQTWNSYLELRQNRGLKLTLLAQSYFWFLASAFDLLILLFSTKHLGLGETGTGVLLTALMVGIGVGSYIAGLVSEGKVELGLVPIGGIGLAVFSGFLFFANHSPTLTFFLLLLLGLSSGYFIIPLNSYFQKESPQEMRGRFLAVGNFTSALGMMFGAVLVALLDDYFGFSPRELFLGFGAVSMVVAIYITTTLPGALIRCINWIVTHIIYRIRTVGIDNLPAQGGALLVCNHVSYVDALLVQSVVKRPVRFLMYRPIYENKFIRPIADAVGTIPVSPGAGSKEALEEARKSIERGELVCIFAEGAISRIGHLLPFRGGLEKIMATANAPIIPLYLDELWGSVFSFSEGKFFWKVPKEVPYPVTLSFGDPLPSNSSAQQVRAKVQELGAASFATRSINHKLLHEAFLSQAKRTPFRAAVVDSVGQSLRYCELLPAVLALRDLLSSRFRKGERVGLLLPPSSLGVMSNLALLSLGAIPVNLNHTVSKEAFQKMLDLGEIKTILTAQKYLEKIEVEPTEMMLLVESLLQPIEKSKRIKYFLTSLLVPSFILKRLYFESSITPDDLATVMFSSGSTGDPKGIMLTHGNISSNIEAIYQLLQLSGRDVLLGSLPFFHSFGFTDTLFLPLLGGISVVYHPNPVDSGQITRLIKKHSATMLLTTPTFLQLYARKAEPEDLKTLRYIVVGAEKLRESARTAFEGRFNLTLLEGYGCTELSPVALVNVPDFGEGKTKQRGNKPGTVGHPLPGVMVKIVDPETYKEIPNGQPGMLLVKGPNVMKGYLGEPGKTEAVMKDGYYITGDLALLDDDGFVIIQDRLSRFSKIGGEMVPHLKIEDAMHDALGAEEQIVAVTGIPDEKRGERIVVLATRKFEPAEVLKKMTEAGLPNLWIPKSDDIFFTDSLPLLGTGKLDLRAIKQQAEQLANLN